MRLGNVYDQAKAKAEANGETIAVVVARKLAEYLAEGQPIPRAGGGRPGPPAASDVSRESRFTLPGNPAGGAPPLPDDRPIRSQPESRKEHPRAMGTNFYWRETPCGSCGRYDKLHVGKNSGGWSFGFRGYPHNPDDGIISPVGYPVLSRADWRRVFTDKPGRLADEYGRDIPDPIDWLNTLTPPTLEQQRSEWSRERMGPFWDPTDIRDWRDPEDFRFASYEFS